MFKRSLAILGLAVLSYTGLGACVDISPPPAAKLPGKEVGKRILVFTKTLGYRHDSIPVGIAAVKKICAEQGWELECSEDSAVFTAENLSRFRCVLFLSTSGDILSREQEKAFEAYIQSGGGFAGVHAATDTEFTWPWYTRLVGAQFSSHGPIQKAAIDVCADGCSHPSTSFLPKRFERTDEWYNFKRLSPTTTKILNLDETGLNGATHGKSHPIAWFHEFDGGRAWYTAGGHTSESFAEPAFVKHLAEGLRWAGHLDARNFQLVDQKRLPSDDHFETDELISNLEDPMGIAPFPDGRVLVLERLGVLKLYTPGKGVSVVTKLHTRGLDPREQRDQNNNWYEGGGLGIALDPDYGVKNDFVYIYYSQPDITGFSADVIEHNHIRLSRFRFDGKILSDEKLLLTVDDDRGQKIGHVAGALCFGKDRKLFLSTGDNTCTFASDGFTPIDERPGRSGFDAQRSSGNSNDLRGSILRIRINETGDGYTIPEGNLWKPGTAKTRPEIFVKGCRNPWRFAYDSKTGGVAWGDVGPDGNTPNVNRGPRGYDLICFARKAGYYGWPYFRGDTYYVDFDFTSGKSGQSFEKGIFNNSPNNTGLHELPPLQRPLLWYPYDTSENFPEMGSGGRNADISVIYNQEGRPSSFPVWFDQVLISHDWMRCQTKLIKLDAQGRLETIQDFLPSLGLRHPIHIAQDAHGSLYFLDYGGGWFNSNNGRLVKVSFAGWNRRPRVETDLAERFDSLASLQKFSAKASDPEGKAVTGKWDFGDGSSAAGFEASHVYAKPGSYEVTFTATDADGQSASRKLRVNAGNGRPSLELALKSGSKTFTWGESLPVSVKAIDPEDGDISSAAVISAEYGIPFDAPPAAPNLAGLDPSLPGGKLMVANICISCHNATSANVGPSFSEVAKRYKDDKDRDAKLFESITKGSNGKWGGHSPMPAMGHIAAADIKSMIAAINSLATIHSVGVPVVDGVVKTPAIAPAGLPANSLLTVRAQVSDKATAGLPAISAGAKLHLEALKIMTLKDGLTEVPADLTHLTGKGIRMVNDAIGYLDDPDLKVTWTIEAPADGDYAVALELANAIHDQGRGTLSANGISREVICPKTTSWDSFTKIELGKLPLKKGRNQLVFKVSSLTPPFGNIRKLSLQKN